MAAAGSRPLPPRRSPTPRSTATITLHLFRSEGSGHYGSLPGVARIVHGDERSIELSGIRRHVYDGYRAATGAEIQRSPADLDHVGVSGHGKIVHRNAGRRVPTLWGTALPPVCGRSQPSGVRSVDARTRERREWGGASVCQGVTRPRRSGQTPRELRRHGPRWRRELLPRRRR